MRFRNFIAENPLISETVPGYVSSSAYSGPLGLPDLSLGAVGDVPGQAPAGGYDNISGFTGSVIDKIRYSDRLEYLQLQTLQKLGIMANNIVITLNQKDPAQIKMTDRYKMTKFLDNRYICGLPLRAMFSDGGYPELRQQDVDIGTSLGVVIDDPHPPTRQELIANKILPDAKIFAIDVEVLRRRMYEIKEKVADMERRFKSWNFLAGKADQAFQLASGSSKIGLSKGANPLSGS